MSVVKLKKTEEELAKEQNAEVVEEKSQEDDPKAVRFGVVAGMRNDGTPVLVPLGNPDLLQIVGFIKFAQTYMEEVLYDVIQGAKKKMEEEAQQLQQDKQVAFNEHEEVKASDQTVEEAAKE